jgi:hypothetical protein
MPEPAPFGLPPGAGGGGTGTGLGRGVTLGTGLGIGLGTGCAAAPRNMALRIHVNAIRNKCVIVFIFSEKHIRRLHHPHCSRGRQQAFGLNCRPLPLSHPGIIVKLKFRPLIRAMFS